jgi:hypothetical protein
MEETMLKQTSITLALMFAFAGHAVAAPTVNPPMETLSDAEIYGHRGATPERMREMLAWIAANVDLPEVQELPSISFASPKKLAAMRYRGLLPHQWSKTVSRSNETAESHNIVALYEDRTRTIHLPENWTGTTITEQSILLHELVHHIQNVAGLKYECAFARESPAYKAQGRWLREHGLDLETEFDVDMFTLLVRSSCHY